MYGDTDEEDMPQYCNNCCMTRPPLEGRGDYIGERLGMVFVSVGYIQGLTYPKTKKVKCGVFYVEDEAWSGGYRRFELASDYDYEKSILEEDGLHFDPESDVFKQASKERTLSVGLADLWVWKEDFEEALQGFGLDKRQASSMYNDDEKPFGLIDRSGKAKDFVEVALVAYKKKFGDNPIKLGQLLNFASGNDKPIAGYTITLDGKGNDRKVHLGEGNDPVSYKAVAAAYKNQVKKMK